MIQSDFYPTDTTTSGVEKTATITNLNLTDMSVDPFAAYYMGAIPNDKCLWYVPKKCTVDYNSNPMQSKLKLTNVDTAKLYWGYGALSDDGAVKTAWNETNSKYQSSMRLINSMYAYKLDTYGTVAIGIILRQYHDVTLESGLLVGTQIAAMANAQTFTMTCSEYLDWVLNGTSLTVTFNEQEYEIKYNDFNSDGVNFLGTGIIATITSMSMGKLTAHESSTIQYIFPFVSTQVGDRFYARCGVSVTNVNDCRVQFKRDLSEIKIKESSGYSDIGLDGTDLVVINRGIEWEITGEFMDYVRRNGYTIPHYFLYSSAITCRYTGYSGSGSNTLYEFSVEPQYRPQDFWTLFCLINRYSLNSNRETKPEYTTNNTIALFNADNSPKLERQTFTTYADIERKLRDWQKYGYNIIDDEFNPDKPTPEPGDDTPDDEPEDIDDAYGDGDEDQDDIVITAPSQFITQYILTASQLRTVGSNLWSSWVDPNTDVYKNFLFDFFQDTGTFNITAALDYIIALRVYPFSLAGMTTEYLGVSNGVYMGTGHTNFCPGTIPTLNTVIGYLDAGTLDVNLHVPYKDFRDLYNCSVMAFLPFCGTVELNPVEIIGKKLHAKYFIDFQSGACTAVIRVNNDGVEYTIASKSGQIGFMLPVSATNSGQLAAQYAGDSIKGVGTIGGFFFDVFGSVGRSVAGAASAGAGGGAGGEGASSALTESGGFTPTETIGMAKSGFNSFLSLANQATDMLSRSGIDMPMLSGGTGAESLFMPPYVCLQVRRGKYAKPNNYPHSVGYYNLSSNPISYYRGAYQGSPATGSNTGKGLCTFTGVDTSGLDCREDERAEILELLNTGIYL